MLLRLEVPRRGARVGACSGWSRLTGAQPQRARLRVNGGCLEEARRNADDLDLSGLDVDPADVNEALAVNAEEWRKEIPLIEEWFEFVGEKLPTGIKDEFDALKHRLAEAD